MSKLLKDVSINKEESTVITSNQYPWMSFIGFGDLVGNE